MLMFLAILGTEFKRFLYSKKFILFLLFLSVAVYAVHMDCIHFKKEVNDIKSFQETESQSMDNIGRYTIYQVMGFKVLFRPGSLSALFNCSGYFPGCTAHVTGLTALHIYQDLKGSAGFPRISPIPLDVSGLLLVLGSLYAILFWGYPSLRNQEYLRMISSNRSKFSIHFGIVFSRLLILILKLFIVLGILIAVLLYHDIDSLGAIISGLNGYFVVTAILLIFFFLLGVLAGQICERLGHNVTTVIVAWFLLVFFVSCSTNYLVRDEAQKIGSPYRMDLEKLVIALDFEKKAERKGQGKFDRTRINVARQIIEDFWLRDYQQITELEKHHIKKIETVIDYYEKVNMFTPITLYTATTSELSTQGGRNFITFYYYALDLQVKFVRFIIDRTYYNEPNNLVPFIKNNENIFPGVSRLPKYFLVGCLINLGYIILLYFFSFLTFKKFLLKMKKTEIEALGEVKIEMKQGEYYPWLVKSDYFKNLLLNLFCGNFREIKQKGFVGDVVVNGTNIAIEKMPGGFLYFCPPCYLPGDMKTKDFITLFIFLNGISHPYRTRREVIQGQGIKSLARKRIALLSEAEKFDILLAILQLNLDFVFLIDNIATGLDITYSIRLKELLEKKQAENRLAIYLSSTSVFEGKEMREHFNEGSYWIYSIEGDKRQLQAGKRLSSQTGKPF